MLIITKSYVSHVPCNKLLIFPSNIAVVIKKKKKSR